MYRRFIIPALIAALAGVCATQSANAFNLGLSRGMSWGLERIAIEQPQLPPFAHARFCVQYPDDCKVKRMAFRPKKLQLTYKRLAELMAINTQVNRSIKFEANLGGVAAERWIIGPKNGDCNDYAVTKRHELLARGWPSRSLLLAEVVVPSGEHHLVVVVRAKEGDLVIDNLNANVRPWFKTPVVQDRVSLGAHPVADEPAVLGLGRQGHRLSRRRGASASRLPNPASTRADGGFHPNRMKAADLL
jgi:predicted transglutaminase-like cysteine proteinase